jgi:hypothetical protein
VADALAACALAAGVAVWGSETSAGLPPSLIVSITSVVER